MSDNKTVEEKVRKWLDSEGYPLEFRTALAFDKQGFTVRQGHYARSSEEELREIDVLAYYTELSKLLRIYHVVECKWSGDKPWVIFSSESASMAASACVNQAISSLLGQSTVWILAGESEVAKLGLFSSPSRAGFSGRQAFSKGNDIFFAAVQSVVSKAKSIVDQYDENCNLGRHLPEWAVVAFPVVVVKGGLFEAYLDPTSAEILVESARHLRIHWRGSNTWRHHASVDIISEDYVDQFATSRAAESAILLRKMEIARDGIERCWKSKSLKALDFKRAPRGTTGLPAVLRAIQVRQPEKKTRRPQKP